MGYVIYMLFAYIFMGGDAFVACRGPNTLLMMHGMRSGSGGGSLYIIFGVLSRSAVYSTVQFGHVLL